MAAAATSGQDGRGALSVMSEGTIYQFVDAILERNAAKAFRYFDKEALPLLAKQISTLLKIKDWGDAPVAPLKEALKVHPFVFQKSTQLAKKFLYEDLRLIHRELLTLDTKIKRGVSNPGILISHFIASII